MLGFKGVLSALTTLGDICSLANLFLSSTLNSVSLYPICVLYIIDGVLFINCFPFNFYVQFDVAQNRHMVTSNIDLADDCNGVWLIC